MPVTLSTPRVPALPGFSRRPGSFNPGRARNVGFFDGTAKTMRHGFVYLVFFLLAQIGCGGGSSTIQTAPPPPPPSATRFLPRFFLKFSQRPARRHEPRSHVVRQPAQWLHRFSPSHPYRSARRRHLKSSKPFQCRCRLERTPPVLRRSKRLDRKLHNYGHRHSGSLSHPANLGLTIQTGVVANFPRTAYARTDSIPAMDDPSWRASPSAHRLRSSPSTRLRRQPRDESRRNFLHQPPPPASPKSAFPAQAAPIFPPTAPPFGLALLPNKSPRSTPHRCKSKLVTK